jgi:hypothetical protein
MHVAFGLSEAELIASLHLSFELPSSFLIRACMRARYPISISISNMCVIAIPLTNPVSHLAYYNTCFVGIASARAPVDAVFLTACLLPPASCLLPPASHPHILTSGYFWLAVIPQGDLGGTIGVEPLDSRFPAFSSASGFSFATPNPQPD